MELRHSGRAPSRMIIVTFEWKLARAYPRIVTPDGRCQKNWKDKQMITVDNNLKQYEIHLKNITGGEVFAEDYNRKHLVFAVTNLHDAIRILNEQVKAGK